MKFGVREICNVVFRAKSEVKIGNTTFKIGQPVLYLDSAKTSTLAGEATTVYATGGRGNTNLVAWEGEKTLTFTVEDALISPLGFSILSGAGLVKGGETDYVHVHTTSTAIVDSNSKIDLSEALEYKEILCKEAPLFILATDEDGSLTGTVYTASDIASSTTEGKTTTTITTNATAGSTVFVDYYIKKVSSKVSEIQIDAENFAGYYYVEADTLFRKQIDGVDAPVNITLPNVKIQSNFSFSMASTGDPSTFTFTMDAFPGYTYFDKTKKVLCVMQIVEDASGSTTKWNSVMTHSDTETVDINRNGRKDNKTSDTAVKDSWQTDTTAD